VALSQPVVFVLPETHDEVSGGNLYNAALLSALGDSARRVSVSQWQTTPQQSGVYLIDSLNLNEFDQMQSSRVEGQFFILLVHHLPSLEPGLNLDDPQRTQESRILGAFDAFLATSPFTRDYLQSGGHEQPIVTIEPILAMREASERRLNADQVRALMSCNLIARKGVLEFLEALAASSQASDQYHIDIVGRKDLDPKYSDACARCIASSKLLVERVILRGVAEYDAMPGWYEQANLFLSASRMETFGISLQEARHSGLPILAVEGGNSGNHVDRGVTGELFADPEAMAQGFLTLVRSQTDLLRYSEQAQKSRLLSTETWTEAAARLRLSLEQWFPS
jgi:glycosyltransferase involved in cell wall biosynthesis